MADKPTVKPGLYVFCLIIVGILLVAAYLLEVKPTPMPHAFSLSNKSYNITGYAYTQSEQEKGLMNVTITNSTFMLFQFPVPGIYEFWMKNTYNGLDIIWLDYNSSTNVANVVYYVNATPCIDYDKMQQNCIVYIPNAFANYVIETKSGFVQQNNITIGDKVNFLFGAANRPTP